MLGQCSREFVITLALRVTKRLVQFVNFVACFFKYLTHSTQPEQLCIPPRLTEYPQGLLLIDTPNILHF